MERTMNERVRRRGDGWGLWQPYEGEATTRSFYDWEGYKLAVRLFPSPVLFEVRDDGKCHVHDTDSKR